MASNPVEGWQVLPLSELAHYVNGRATKPAEARDSGTMVVKIRELNGGVSGSTVFVDDDVVDPKHRITAGDLLFAWSASVGIYQWGGPDAALNQHIWKVEAKPGIDQTFLRYCLEGEIASLIAAAEERRTTMGHVRKADLERLTAVIPPLNEQRAIAEILGALDDRIEWCLDTAKNCLETMQAVASGGTRKLKVSDLAEFVNGGAFTKGATGAGRLIIKISELNSGVSAASKFSDVEAPASRIADTGDVLFSWSATLDVFRWTGEQALINQHIFKVIPSKGLPMWLVFAKLAEAMPEFQKIAADRATTMGHIKKTHLDQVTVDIADVEELSARDELGSSLWDQHLTLSLQAAAAQRTRNLLLPELVSGRLRVDDVDGFLERAGLA